MFSLKNIFSLIILTAFILAVKVTPVYAAGQVENFVQPTAIQTSEISDYSMQPYITLTVENGIEVETFFPAETFKSKKIQKIDTPKENVKNITPKKGVPPPAQNKKSISTQYVSQQNSAEVTKIEQIYSSQPYITLTVENDLVVETFYPSNFKI